ncbi:MAG TPA: cytochrome c3 family protein [Kofleriaceae bacterium]
MKPLRLIIVFAIVCAAAGGFADRNELAFSPVVYPPQRLPLIFSHAKHIARGTTCVQCHPGGTTSRSTIDNLLPTEANCLGCHAIDRNDPAKVATPVAACAGCHPGFKPGVPVERSYVMSSSLKFDHSAHVKSTCESCHGDLRNVDLATTRDLPTMASCLSCHLDGGDQRQCTSCHFAAIGGLMETKFPHGELVPRQTGLGDEHGPMFERDHKQQARRNDATCNACHDKSECVECHQGVVKPAEFHTGNYLLVHASEAKRGRPDCSACHRAQTVCVACHERSGLGTRGETDFNSRDPIKQFHPLGWASQGAGPNLHAAVAKRSVGSCASCHREEDCLQCHSAEATSLRVSPHGPGWRGSSRCRALDRGNRRMCLRCHITQDELGCDWSK